MNFLWICVGILQGLLMLPRLIGSDKKTRRQILNPAFYAIVYGGLFSGLLTFFLSYVIADTAILCCIFFGINILFNIFFLIFSKKKKR